MGITVTQVVSVPRGSWRWQDAYSLSTYAPHRTKDGRWVWRSIGRARGKWSMPQIRRSGWHYQGYGSLHNEPISADDLRWLALA